MKILLLTDWEFPCDHRFLKYVYGRHLSRAGHEIIWVMRPSEKNSEILEKEWMGNKVYVLREADYDNYQVFLSCVTKTLDRHPVYGIFQSNKEIDVIHVRNDYAMGMVASYITRRHKSCPYIHQITHLKAESMKYNARNLQHLPHKYVLASVAQRLRKRLSSNAEITLAISDAMRSYLLDHGYRPPIRVLTTGADTTVSPEDVSGSLFEEQFSIDSGHMMLYIGSMSPHRNLEFLFEVQKEVIQEFDTTLVMAGGRERSHISRLQKKASEIGVADSVVFTGWIADEELVNSAVKSADIGLCPLPVDIELYQYNAPIKLLEYLTLQTPVVGTDSPDQKTVLSESGGGFAVKYDVEEFSIAVKQLLSMTEQQRNELGRSGRRYIKKHRDFDILAENAIDVYHEALKL